MPPSELPGGEWSRGPHDGGAGVFACWACASSRVRGFGGGSGLFRGVPGGIGRCSGVCGGGYGVGLVADGQFWTRLIRRVGSRQWGAVRGWFMGVPGWV